jgi:hypothetical protein
MIFFKKGVRAFISGATDGCTHIDDVESVFWVIHWIIRTHTSLGSHTPKIIPALFQDWTDNDSISLVNITKQKCSIIQSVFILTLQSKFLALQKLIEKFHAFLQICAMRYGMVTHLDAILGFSTILAIFDGVCCEKSHV